MKIRVKVRFNTSLEKFESFGNNMYLVYLTFEQDDEAEEILKQILSRKLGLPIGRILFLNIDPLTKDWIFELQ